MPSDPQTDESAAIDVEQRLHPLTLLFEALRVARAFLIPALIVGFTAGDGVERFALWTLAVLAVPAIFRSVVKYATYRYRVTGDELLIQSGLLHKHRRIIPLDRVQNIDTSQSALQRLFGMAELRVETASGDSADATLTVLARDRAEAVRAELLRRRRAVEAGVEPGGEMPEPPPVRTVARLSLGQLALLGATSNRVGIIAAALFGLLQFALQLGIDIPEPAVDPEEAVAAFSAVMWTLIALAVITFFLVIGWVLSIVTVTLEYFGFTLERTEHEIQKHYGLLSRRQATVLLRRVQAVRVEESVVRRWLGLTAMRVESAGAELGARQQGRVEAFLPLASLADVPRLVREVFRDLDFGALRILPVHPRARLRAAIRYTVPLLLLTVALSAWRGADWLWLLGLVPLTLFGAHLHYRHLGYALAPGYVIARSGFWTRITWMVPLHKIQTLHVVESPFQRRHGLATLIVDTAVGGGQDGAQVIDLGRDDALTLQATLYARMHTALDEVAAARRVVAGRAGAISAPSRGEGDGEAAEVD